MNYPTLLWVALAVYSLVRVARVARYRRLRRMERECLLLKACAQRFDQLQQQERE